MNVPLLGHTKQLILLELRGNVSHGYELAKQLNVPLTGIYQHLKELTEEGLIDSKKEGRKKIYSLTTKGEKLVQLLKD